MICDWQIRILLFSVAAYFSIGCFVLPKPTGIKDLVRKTERIVLAQVSDVETQEFISQNVITYKGYHFSTIENIKGNYKKHFSLFQYHKPTNTDRQFHGNMLYAYDFNGHSDSEFWNDAYVGRGDWQSNCQIYAYFQKGKTYLIFLGEPHIKGYELIDSVDDNWLITVRELARSNTRAKQTVGDISADNP